MIKTLEYRKELYPSFQADGFAAQFAFPYASKVCQGVGYDIGCMKKEWAFPGSIPIDISFNDGFDAYNLPQDNVDYVFTSHCLEHLDDWVKALDYWTSLLKFGGVLFLYLPDYSQKYWRPWNNRKHKHVFSVETIRGYMEENNYTKIFSSEKDLNNSFMVMGEKTPKIIECW